MGDVYLNAEQDLSLDSVVDAILDRIWEHSFFYASIATPCESFSMRRDIERADGVAPRLRSKAHPEGLPHWDSSSALGRRVVDMRPA